jgi:ribose transport system substrate-binding protein
MGETHNAKELEVRKALLLLIAALALAVTGCGEDNDSGGGADSAAAPPAKVKPTTGPNGEKAALAGELTLSQDEIDKVKALNATAAFTWHTSSLWVDAVEAGARSKFEALGIEVVATTDADFDPAKQASDVETVTAKKPDVIVANVVDAGQSASAFRPAVDSGSKIVFISDVPKGYRQDADYVGLVDDDYAAMGKVAADLMGEALEGKGKVGFIYHDANFHVTKQRDDAFKASLQQKYPDIEIAAEAGMADPAKAEEIAHAMLTKNSDLDGVYVPWAEPATGVLAALRSAGTPDVKVVTLDLDNDVALDMAQGKNVVGISADRAFQLGEAAATEAAYGLLGKKAPPFSVVGAIDVTKDNLLARWKESLGVEAPAELVEAAG